STVLLKHVYELVKKEGYSINNIDSNIIAQSPKMMPYIPKMKDVLCDILDLKHDELSIKAKTNESMDAVGQKLAIEAHLMIRDRYLYLVAVIERILTRKYVIDFVFRECVDQHFLFQLQLVGIINMTVIAASAFVGDRTCGLYSIWRLPDQLIDDADRIVFLFGDDLHIGFFALDHALDKDHQLISSGDPQALNGHIDTCTA
ncbi:MAG: 2-C-methyl-D-erythritol 2,4-cyclodiphosphate synthase, partial [Erysipelotrichaceae bacterium]|nr:2-C-methyl-D-erythritol 2,4-cyclodiphosphate synthase [Erysipelotrichaceae bacterium]